MSLEEIDFNNVKENEDSVPENYKERPSPFSIGWHDYVMSEFSPEELVDGQPTVDGLRRVTQLLLGPIIDQKVKISYVDEHSVNAIFKITLQEDSELRCFVGAADCTPRNCTDKTFQVFPTAIAETRAEGRAYRKALGLRSIAAEEKAEVNLDTPTITDNQINTIKMLCGKVKIDYDKFVNYYTGGDIEKDTYQNGVKMLTQLNSFRNDPKQIPQVLKG